MTAPPTRPATRPTTGPTTGPTSRAHPVSPVPPLALPWRLLPDGAALAVRLTPRGGRAGCDGIGLQDGQPVLKLRVPAPPVEGAANEALTAFLAKALALPRSAVTLVAGDRARVKRLHLSGGPGLEPRLRALAGLPEAPDAG